MADMHSVTGVGKDTTVTCPNTTASEFTHCPYCGDPVTEAGHELYEFDGELDEVHCPGTLMSTYRYCPYCGDRTEMR